MKYLSQIATVLAAVTITSTSVVKSPSITPGDGNFELLILHNNDMHARFEQTSQLSGACTIADREAGKCYGGFPRVAHVVKEARRAAASGEGPPVLYLNAGDTYTGTAWFTIYKWKIAAEFINALQPDAVSLGNHELDDDVDGIVPFIKNVTTPVLAANLILDKVPELKSEPNLKNSTVITKNGVKIGIIGYLTPETKFLAPKNDIEYEDEIIAMRREAVKLKKQGVNILIGLGHSGYIKDLEIAGKVHDLDLVIGGHSNTFLSNNNNTKESPEVIQGPYPVWVMQASGRKVPVVQAYAYTKYLGKLHLIFDSIGEIIECDGAPILLNQKVPKDPELEALVETYRGNIDIVNNEVLGTSMVLLNGESCRLRECNMGNLITDSVVFKTKKYMFGQYSDVNIAIIQGGRIRASIFSPTTPPFSLTRGDWITVLPFSDTLSIVTMNGTVLLQMLEHSVSSWRILDTPGQFLQFSGLKVVYDLSKPPGFRVVKAKTLSPNSIDPTLYDIKENQTYKVVMCTFLVDGGDGYVMFEGLERETLPYNEITSVTEYLQQFSPVNPEVSDRITIINEDSLDNFGNFIPTNSINLGRTMTSRSAYLGSQINYVNFLALLIIMYSEIFL